MNDHESTAAPGFGQDSATTVPPDIGQLAAPLTPIKALLAAVHETNRLLGILIAQQDAASQRQNPRTYQTVRGG